eukprot:13790902-Alexandrium_andersonii.AAC.1
MKSSNFCPQPNPRRPRSQHAQRAEWTSRPSAESEHPRPHSRALKAPRFARRLASRVLESCKCRGDRG